MNSLEILTKDELELQRAVWNRMLTSRLHTEKEKDLARDIIKNIEEWLKRKSVVEV